MEKITQQIADTARWALLEEVRTTPKPGLVDCDSNGAHTDMDVCTFVSSAEALYPYFKVMAAYGWSDYNNPERLFEKIRPVGKLAEEAMYQATDGVNTHKGLIFSIGILSAAAAAVYRRKNAFIRNDIFAEEMQMVHTAMQRELNLTQQKKESLTNGEKVYQTYGSLGVRGEALYGYAAVRNLSLPVVEEGVQKHRPFDRIKIQALLMLMSQVEDSNILSRSNMDMLRHVQGMSREFLNTGGVYRDDGIETMKQWDKQFTEWNISPGGAADLLAITLFIYRLTGGNYGISGKSA